MHGIRIATAKNFTTEVLGSTTPVLVDFWAEWCAPCRQTMPILQEIAEEYSERIALFKLNVDEESETAMRFGITSIPTIKIFVGGQVAKTIVGAQGKAQLLEIVKDCLRSSATDHIL